MSPAPTISIEMELPDELPPEWLGFTDGAHLLECIELTTWGGLVCVSLADPLVMDCSLNVEVTPLTPAARDLHQEAVRLAACTATWTSAQWDRAGTNAMRKVP